MTEAKHVAKTLKNVLDHPVMIDAMNRESDIMKIVETVGKWWEYDLYKRKPGPAYQDGIFVGTDLDLSTFLYALAERHAPIIIPEYKRASAKTTREGEMCVSDKDRRGPILSLSANKELFSMSIKIQDSNIMSNEGGVGEPRNFMVNDYDGEWYPGWKTIQFMPDAEETKFLTENKLWSGSKIVFKNFVHPNRWISMFGVSYFITKFVGERIDAECRSMNAQIKKILESGIKYPETGEDAPKTHPKSVSGPKKSMKFPAFQVEIDVPDNDTKFRMASIDQESLIALTKMRNTLVYNIGPKLRFAIRCTELAYYKHGEGKMPAWLKNVKWEPYKAKGKKITWDRLVLMQPGVGKRAVGLRKRKYEKSIKVDIDYGE